MNWIVKRTKLWKAAMNVLDSIETTCWQAEENQIDDGWALHLIHDEAEQALNEFVSEYR